MKILIGIFAGILNGLFSTGGGLILVPAFIYLLKMDEINSRATTIFCILPMVVLNLILYKERIFNINFKMLVLVIIGGTLGGYIGTKLLNRMPIKIIRGMFSIFLIYASIRYIFY